MNKGDYYGPHWVNTGSKMGPLFSKKFHKVGQSGADFMLQRETRVFTKWDMCYKVRHLFLQSGTCVTKLDICCYKVGHVLQS